MNGQATVVKGNLDVLRSILTGDSFTEGEKYVVKWQFNMLGSFQTELMGLISRADDDNLKLLSLGFPTQVAGFLHWNRGNLANRLKEAGLEL